MMSNQHNPIAGRYAEALFEWVQSEQSPADMLSILQQLQQVFADTDGLYDVMANPTMARDSKHAMFSDALQSVPSAVTNLIQLLIEHDRFGLYPDVVGVFQTLVDKQDKRARGEVITATPISDVLLDTIADKLKASAGFNEVFLVNTVDPNVLGGAVLQLGDQRVDGSFSSQLKQLLVAQ